MARMMLAVRRPTPKLAPSKKPVQPKYLDEEGAELVAHDGHEDEDGPEAVDDGGDGGEQLGEEGDGRAQGLGAELRDEDGDAEGQRHGDEEREERGGEGAEDEGQRAEVAVDRIPGGAGEELASRTGGRRELGAADEDRTG